MKKNQFFYDFFYPFYYLFILDKNKKAIAYYIFI
jgi:hypothetical protein